MKGFLCINPKGTESNQSFIDRIIFGIVFEKRLQM